MGRIVADIIRVYERTAPDELGGSIERHLSQLNVTSTYWPGDDEIRSALRTEQLYRRSKKARLRMLLEAIEDHYRQTTNQPQVPHGWYPIEHILPQQWAENWPVHGEDAEEVRAEHVHRLGNLTLLTSSLNSKVSNGPWSAWDRRSRQHANRLTGRRTDTRIVVRRRKSSGMQSQDLIDAGVPATGRLGEGRAVGAVMARRPAAGGAPACADGRGCATPKKLQMERSPRRP